MQTANVAQLKAKLSGYLSLVDMKKEEIVIEKRGKPIAVIVPLETFEKSRSTFPADRDALEQLPSRLDRFGGILEEEEIDRDYREGREAYLHEKHGS